MKHKFITIEGGEGSGKTTLIKLLKKDLDKDNYDFLISREPGGSKISEEIRKIILDKDNVTITSMTETLLYAASRTQHLEEVILPALKSGKLVICDRYLDASLAYQGYSRGVGIDKVYEINMLATNNILPDLTIYIDLDPTIGLNRIQKSNREMDRLDLEKISFHKKVREGYLEVARRFPKRIITLNGDLPLDSLYLKLKEIIYKRI